MIKKGGTRPAYLWAQITESCHPPIRPHIHPPMLSPWPEQNILCPQNSHEGSPVKMWVSCTAHLPIIVRRRRVIRMIIRNTHTHLAKYLEIPVCQSVFVLPVKSPFWLFQHVLILSWNFFSSVLPWFPSLSLAFPSAAPFPWLTPPRSSGLSLLPLTILTSFRITFSLSVSFTKWWALLREGTGLIHLSVPHLEQYRSDRWVDSGQTDNWVKKLVANHQWNSWARSRCV